MIAFYAMGGGWGHLTRVKTFIEHAGIHFPFKVITANRDVELFFDSQSIIYIPANEQSTREDLAALLNRGLQPFQFNECYIDVFPCGILGELTMDSIPCDRLHYLGRRLIWNEYEKLFEKPVEFESSFLFEELEEPHYTFLLNHSKKVEKVELRCPLPDKAFTHPLFGEQQPIWLIVHTSNPAEVRLLLDHARDIASIERVEPHFVVLSNEWIDEKDIHCFTDQNPINWYPMVERIFSACGFNSWYQLATWRVKHVSLPFKRKFDDQFWRSSQR